MILLLLWHLADEIAHRPATQVPDASFTTFLFINICKQNWKIMMSITTPLQTTSKKYSQRKLHTFANSFADLIRANSLVRKRDLVGKTLHVRQRFQERCHPSCRVLVSIFVICNRRFATRSSRLLKWAVRLQERSVRCKFSSVYFGSVWKLFLISKRFQYIPKETSRSVSIIHSSNLVSSFALLSDSH
jgi:hypothetical protein